MISIKCQQCNKNIYLKDKNKLYRCCDANVCSYNCSLKRFKNIQSYDPELNYPTNWQNLNISNIYDNSNILSFEKDNSNANKNLSRTKSINNILNSNIRLNTIYENSNKSIDDYDSEENNHDNNINSKNIYKYISIRIISLIVIIYNTIITFY